MVNFYINGTESGEIRFPITEVGGTSKMTVMIENDSIDEIELIPYMEDPDITINKYPKTLFPGEKAESVWTFSPSHDRVTRRRQENKPAALNAECGFKVISG